jgi:outer membrane protein
MTLRRYGSIALTCAALLGLPAVASAAERGDFQLRGRVISIIPDDDSGQITGVAGSGVDVDSQATVEVDLTWFLSSNVALELIAATAEHDISGNGTAAGLGKIADAGVLPPTLTVQYHWNTDGKVQPYLGAGINYTIFYDEDVTPSLDGFLMTTSKIDLDESFGFAAQAGIDFMLSDNWFFNIDLKYIDIDTTAVIRDDTTNAELARVDVDINPFVPGIGVGYRW